MTMALTGPTDGRDSCATRQPSRRATLVPRARRRQWFCSQSRRQVSLAFLRENAANVRLRRCGRRASKGYYLDLTARENINTELRVVLSTRRLPDIRARDRSMLGTS